MRYVCCLVLLIMMISPVSGETLKGSVRYTVDSARSAAFENMPKKLSGKELKKYKQDRLNKTHLYLISMSIGSHKELSVYKIVPFYKNLELVCYGIQYTDKPECKFYYTPEGALIKYELISNTEYPQRTITYSPYNRILSVNLIVGPKESFIFNKDKSLYAHWLNDMSYDKDNNMTDVVRRF